MSYLRWYMKGMDRERSFRGVAMSKGRLQGACVFMSDSNGTEAQSEVHLAVECNTGLKCTLICSAV